jgi:DNA-repair protein XRCC2
VQEHAATIPALYSAEADPDALHQETMKALARVHIFYPTSSVSLAATVLSLPTYVQKNCSDELTFVLLDNMSAFYWQDRFQAEQDKVNNKGKTFSSAAAIRNTLSTINTIRGKLGCVVVLTNWAFPGSGDVQPTSTSPFFRQHLPKPYPSPFVTNDDALPSIPAFNPSHPIESSVFNITHHITLHPPQYKAVSKNTSLENTLKEEPFRSMDQQEIGSMAFVRVPGVEEGKELGRWELVVRQNVIDGL